jgi:hypothetical protein
MAPAQQKASNAGNPQVVAPTQRAKTQHVFVGYDESPDACSGLGLDKSQCKKFTLLSDVRKPALPHKRQILLARGGIDRACNLLLD